MRIVARIDIKNEFVIKGVHLEGLRKLGNPFNFAKNYYEIGVDEIFFNDCVASLYGRNTIFDTIKKSVKEIFIPITVCGGIRSIKNIEEALRIGADKIAINTYAIENPNFIKKAVRYFGSSSIVSSIEAKQVKNDRWEIYKYNGRESTGIDLIYWINKVQDMGCGEIFITSIDFDGTQRGFDINLILKIQDIIKVPFVISGGCSNIKDINKIKKNFKTVDVAIASALHYRKIKKII